MNSKKGLSAQTQLVLIFLLIIAAGAALYFLGYKPLKAAEEALRTQIAEAEQQIETEKIKVAGINRRKEEIEDGKEAGSTVEVYNNSNAEWSTVSDIIKRYATSYSLSFGDAQSDDGVYVRRNMQVSFTAADYTTAKQIIAELAACPYRNMISSVSLNSTGSASGDAGFAGFNADNPVQGSLNILFFETVKGSENTDGLRMNSNG